MTSTVPGNTTAAKAAVLRARNSRLSYAESMRLAGAMVSRERRLQQRASLRPVAPKDARALNGWQEDA